MRETPTRNVNGVPVWPTCGSTPTPACITCSPSSIRPPAPGSPPAFRPWSTRSGGPRTSPVVSATNARSTNDGPGVAPVPPPPNNTQLLVIANLDLLRKLIGGGTLPDGTPLPADTITKMACDAEIVPAVFDSDGQPLVGPHNPSRDTCPTGRGHRPRPRLHRLSRRPRVLPGPPHRPVAQRRHHRPRQPPPRVFQTSWHGPRTRPHHHQDPERHEGPTPTGPVGPRPATRTGPIGTHSRMTGNASGGAPVP